MKNKFKMFAVQTTAVMTGVTLVSLMALMSHNALADEAERVELTQPKSTIEAGVGEVTDSNWKFGQYNGLNKSGPYGIGNFDIQGGGAYDSEDASRWRITGSNAGLENRNFTGEYKVQGFYKLNFAFDETAVYRNNTYQTPYQGVGTANLTLPNNWIYPNPPSTKNMRLLSPAELSDFYSVDIGTKRKAIDGGFSFFFNPQWEIQASFRHEDKKGTQALGAPILAFTSVILPTPVEQSTDQMNASLKYSGDSGFAQFAYYGSLFHNKINGVDFQNAYSALPTFGRMSSMPDNQFHQLSFTGGYNFSPATKLVMNGSYAKTWQDQTFLASNTNGGASLGTLSGNSLNGNVETKAANVKLTHKVNKDLNFAASYKYDERENKTPIYESVALREDSPGVPTAGFLTTPYSKRTQQANFDANYALAQGHWLKAGYEFQNIDRWCNGTWLECADTPTTTEHTGRIDYHGTLFDKLSSKLGYMYSHRVADNYNQDTATWAKSPPEEKFPISSPYAGMTNAELYNQITATGLPVWGHSYLMMLEFPSLLSTITQPQSRMSTA